MKKSEYIEIEKYSNSVSGKTEIHAVRSVHSGSLIGMIHWYGPWRQYVFYPEVQTLWNSHCLETISDYLHKLNKEHRAKLRSAVKTEI